MRTFLWTLLVVLASCATTSAPDPRAMDDETFERELAARFSFPPPQPEPTEGADQSAGQIADAAYLAQFPDFERAYTPTARAQARRLVARLRAEAGGLSHDQFVLRVAEIAALADNAHTHIDGNAFMKNTRRLPVRTYWFPDGLHILRATQTQADLLGARIDAIDGIPVEQVYARVRRYAGGIDAWRRLIVPPLYESPGLLNAAGITADATALTYTGVLADGRPFQRRILGEERDRSAQVSSTVRLLFANEDHPPLASFAHQASAPIYLQHPTRLFTLDPLPNSGLYIGLAYNDDADEGPIAPFLASAIARIGAEHYRYAVLDLRMNTGGDYTTTYAFATDLVDAIGPSGHIYVLNSHWTLSAAMWTAGAVKQAGGDRVIFVGEGVGDRMNFWSEGAAFNLPNAFARVSYTTGRHDFARACDDPHCFWLDLRYPVRIASFEPDIPAPITFEAYRANRDPAMEAVLAHESN